MDWTMSSTSPTTVTMEKAIVCRRHSKDGGKLEERNERMSSTSYATNQPSKWRTTIVYSCRRGWTMLLLQYHLSSVQGESSMRNIEILMAKSTRTGPMVMKSGSGGSLNG
ncbi:hypothetical protein FOMG_19612 [Fusarium oxysporum f. sp. melonis 26406]|uniref:Uncharacterized protein n=1 Tax=Fusarium oxysporum f. sp. melonis 26406 TaxID=1089452 RepID=W9Z4U0_FUSOX|nr:hypothetical protein FOMG_19612 [Fusarium oxysporum f. sp. melonis 26406]